MGITYIDGEAEGPTGKTANVRFGTVTLEILGLVLNPFTRTLQPMRMLLV